MARPRKDAEGPGARERIVEAFWQLIAHEPYAAITIRGLCAAAQVNPNTFYRYFTCMDDLAKQAFDENLAEGFPHLLMGLKGAAGEALRASELRDGAGAAEEALVDEDDGEVCVNGSAELRADACLTSSAAPIVPGNASRLSPADNAARFNRMRLYAQNGSDFLLGILRHAWVDAWLAEAGKTPDELTREQRIDLLMVAGAEMALASLSDQECTLDDFVGVLDRPLGQTMLATLEGIAAR